MKEPFTTPRNQLASVKATIAAAYRFLMGPKGEILAAAFFVMGVWQLLKGRATEGLALLGVAIFLAPNEYGKPVPSTKIRQETERTDLAFSGRRRTLPGWWLWGSILAGVLGLLLLWRWAITQDNSQLALPIGGLAAVIGVVSFSDVRFCIESGPKSLRLTWKWGRLPSLRRIIPYGDIVSYELVDRPWWFLLGMLWISSHSVWNLTPSSVVAVNTVQGKAYLLLCDDPVSLCEAVNRSRLAPPSD